MYIDRKDKSKCCCDDESNNKNGETLVSVPPLSMVYKTGVYVQFDPIFPWQMMELLEMESL